MRIVDKLIQYRFVRYLLGGDYVKRRNKWVVVDVILKFQDGSRVFRERAALGEIPIMYHESSKDIQEIDSYTS